MKTQRSTFVKNLIGKMTLEDKVAQLMQVAYTQMSVSEAETWAKKGVGSFLHVMGEDALRLQRLAVEAGKIPMLFGIDAVHGHCLKKGATLFPSPLSMSSCWEPSLLKKCAQATAKEVSADGLHWTFSPLFCLGRDMRWGRVAETFGEDGFLAGALGESMIQGYQGEDLSSRESILACAKHYIGYGEATGGRDSYDSELTYRKVRSEFLPPFERAVKAGCATVMTAYGSIDGIPCTADKKLLTEILKEELGFDGVVVTDWENLRHLVYTHCVAEDMEEATQKGLTAGNDMMMQAPEFYESALSLLRSGKIEEKSIDEAVARVLTLKEKLGLFKNPYRRCDSAVIGCDEHLQWNKEIARESVVLLKNDGVLPIKKEVKRVAVIGPNADDIRPMVGDWTYFTHPSPNYETPPVRPYYTLAEGMEKVGKSFGVETRTERGCEIWSDDLSDIPKAVELAKTCDLVVLALGDHISQTGEGKDRADLQLTSSQKALFSAIQETGKSVVTAFVSSKPLCIGEIVEKSNAVVTVFNGGQFGGLALAEVLFGKHNPCGKLTVSFPWSVGQMPVYYNQLPGWHASSYVDVPAQPLYSFGYGISYTKYSYTDMRFDEKAFILEVDLQNVGERDGQEITQVYFRDLVSSVMTPKKRLIGFEKTFLKAGQTKRIRFSFKKEDFSLVNAQEKRAVERGEFEIMVGGSSRDEDLLKIKFRIEN